jgi:hypothetical protein
MEKLKVKIKRLSENSVLPKYAKPGDVGMDLTDGTKAFLEPFMAVKDENDVYISCYRHHFNSNKDHSVFIDGGREYARYTIDNELVGVMVEKGEFKII